MQAATKAMNEQLAASGTGLTSCASGAPKAAAARKRQRAGAGDAADAAATRLLLAKAATAEERAAAATAVATAVQVRAGQMTSGKGGRLVQSARRGSSLELCFAAQRKIRGAAAIVFVGGPDRFRSMVQVILAGDI